MDVGFYKNYFELEKNNWWFKARRNIIFSQLDKYIKSKPQEAMVFDLGCGSGFLVGELQKRGFQAYGSDISREAIEYGKNRGIENLKVREGDGVNFPDNYFDLVLALDVLEHIENDSKAIGELNRVLRPGGMAIITVPAYMFLWGVQDEVSRHFRRYTLSKLVEKIKKNSDLRMVKKSYFNTLLFLPIALFRFLSKFATQPKRESDFEIGNGLANSIFYNIFNLETFWLRHFNFPFGVSILLVLRKNAAY